MAVTDHGWWLEAGLEDGPEGVRLVGASFTPLTDGAGATFDKSGGDGEALAVSDGEVFIGFERDHRLMRRTADGRVGAALRHRAFERLGSNKGLEALATLPSGALIAVAERPRDGVHPAFMISGGQVYEAGLPAIGPYFITGADLGPDGWLYVLRRHYLPLVGVSIRVHRYALGSDGLPIPETAQQLAAYEGISGIDNMEGIALWTDARGRTRLLLISDDNFNVVQRTLLMDFVLDADLAQR